MNIRTAKDLGALMREQRKKKKIDQTRLAAMIGVTRQWVGAVERGQTGAEIGLVLRALDALGLKVDISSAPSPKPTETDLDAIINRAKA